MPRRLLVVLPPLLLAGLPWPTASAAQALDLRWLHARYDSAEKAAGGFVLNRDTGSLSGASVRAAAAAAGVEVALEAEQLRGTLAYDGLTQFGLPLATSTGLRWRRASVSVAPATPLDPGGVSIRPSLALEALEIERAIRASASSSPATETLRRNALTAEVSGALALGSWAVLVRIGSAWPLSQRLDVDTFGILDRYALRPGSGRSRGIGLGLSGRLSSRWTLAFDAGRASHEFGASDSVLVTSGGRPAAVSSYPGSTQWMTTASIALRAEWP